MALPRTYLPRAGALPSWSSLQSGRPKLGTYQEDVGNLEMAKVRGITEDFLQMLYGLRIDSEIVHEKCSFFSGYLKWHHPTVLMYRKTSLNDHLHTSTISVYRSLYLGPK